MLFEGKKILVTGGTGSIGKALVDILLTFDPAVVRILSRDENKQFEMQEERKVQKELRFLLGDVRDKERLSYAMKDIDYVFHLAALKHVPACEYNPFEAVRTNVIGSQNVIEAALENKVKKVLFSSSDKAISPTNTMGASKLIAEKLFVSANSYKGNHKTVFSSVRFGNVIGSRGSVIPLFFKKIMKEKKITVTDLKMKRFMMSQTEACSLMLDALRIAKGGEIFVLKMPVVQLNDLVEAIISIVEEKFNILKDEIYVEEIGLRPGEKVVEELLMNEEIPLVYEKDNMFIIPSDYTKVEDASKTVKSVHYRADCLACNQLAVKDIKNIILKEVNLLDFLWSDR
ncbi:polysaccharide biosynthesis protein [Bacillus sp. SM2101]|uniref:polysaccharide biosynthesis protein n=1 Tax=Bacillus sp. SM2101 TaxID=2805366 RepID=UPI001BDEDE7B